MRHTIASFFMAMLIGAVGAPRVEACGDKLLLVGRGFPYFRAYAAIHPASILVYVSSPKKTHGAGSELVSVLTRAGHRAQAATDRAALARNLASHHIDIVLANIVDMPDAEAASIAAGDRPLLLPLLFNATDADLTAAVARYGTAVKDPDSPTPVLTKIDEAMALRQSHAKAKKD